VSAPLSHAPVVSGDTPGALSNWAGNYTYRAAQIAQPGSFDELRALVVGNRSLRAFGSRHSFTDMADAEVMVGFSRLPGAARVEVDAAAMTVTVGPAVTFAELAVVLNQHGLALENLASLPHISVCGAIATATHGSGDHRGNLATAVRGLSLLTSSGEVVDLAGGDPRLGGAAVHLGALGVVLSATLAVVPYYEVSQHVYLDLEWESLLEHLDEVFGLGHSVSVFHALGEGVRSVWVKADAGASVPGDVFGAVPATVDVHPLPGGDASSATAQLGVPGPWSERLPHFRSGFMPSNGAEIQSEVFVGRGDAVEAIRAVLAVTGQLEPILLTGELRTVAGDDLWLSPQYERDSLGLHFTWQRDSDAVAHNVAVIEAALAPFAPRPHWGKVSSLGPEALAGAYPRAGEFAALRAELDPPGRFVNPWMRQHCPWLLEG
jgi:xylitol oxidase